MGFFSVWSPVIDLIEDDLELKKKCEEVLQLRDLSDPQRVKSICSLTFHCYRSYNMYDVDLYFCSVALFCVVCLSDCLLAVSWSIIP